jgi:hypothetical protein
MARKASTTKTTAKKKPAKTPLTAKRIAKAAAGKSTADHVLAAKAAPKKIPAKAYRREDINNITLQYPRSLDWKLAAESLRIRPLYTGKDSRPWRCFTALMSSQTGRGLVNDFGVLPECRGKGHMPDKPALAQTPDLDSPM